MRLVNLPDDALVRMHRRPPRSDLPGVCVALTVIGTWAVVFYHGLFQVDLTEQWSMRHGSDVAATFLLLEFLYTGLFITTHDAMHGTVAYR